MRRIFTLGLVFILTALIASIAIAQKASESQIASTTLVISQVYSGGGGSTGTYLNDYVEIKNISSTPQSLNGLSLVYGSATGQFGSAATLAFALPNVSLNPGQYFLVQTSNPGSAGSAFPVTPDASTTNLSMAAASGKVILANSTFVLNTCGATATPCTLPNAGIIDLVSWGVSNNAEGGVTVNSGVALTSVQGSVRKANGCTDTDNNGADFDVITAPVPRNSNSTAAPCSAVPADAPADFNGDGKTDYIVIRNTGGGPSGQLTWFWQINGGAPATAASDWGLNTDTPVAADYDGDGKDDIAVWRPGAATSAAFYILQSQSNTLRIELFGQTGDNPKVVADYNGDGKDDVAVYRSGAQSIWFYKTTAGGPTTYQPWGVTGDFVEPGDFNGDGKADFTVARNDGGTLRHWKLLSTGATDNSTVFGSSSDFVIPGDYDGDGKADIMCVRPAGGSLTWYLLPSGGGSNSQTTFGLSSDTFAPGDYDGDGKLDVGVFRNGVFYTLATSNGAVGFFQLGSSGDRVGTQYMAN